ncbi:MAG TPA: glycoside hydrolase family 65 protein [Caulobacteraceae bacterium]|jgi:trehalose/maltose hydrolase-like predicted phosphorylase|nr:glycoside hydrolase family 65 protein [Caulobacteraceae bacterium]
MDSEAPISPPPVAGGGGNELPAYLSNGLIGLRVRDNPLVPGLTLLSGFSGEHPVRGIRAAAIAPYPIAADIRLNGVWMSDAPEMVRIIDQAYDFAAGELTSRLAFAAAGASVEIEVLTFCSRDHPTLVCQEIAVTAASPCDVRLRAGLNVAGVSGRALRHHRDTPGEPYPSSDGFLLWESAGGVSSCGAAYVTELVGEDAASDKPPLDGAGLISEYGWRARARRRYRLRQLTTLVPQALHRQPDFQAARLVALAADIGFDAVRKANRACWTELWKGRIRLIGAPERWQAMADAAFFYTMCSVHPSSPSSTSIFGLATWHDYHYYFGHVMWDIETFSVPPLAFLQPGAAEAILDYRLQHLDAAHANARLMGRRGLQFAWESDPSSGDEAAPLPARAAWREDHVSLDIARAFALFADVAGDELFLRDKAWPVLVGVAEWIKSRVVRTGRGYEIRGSMGIAERETPADNPVFTVMSASLVLRATAAAAERLQRPADPAWATIAAGLKPPRRGQVVVSHDGYRRDEEKGATPDPLMGVFPLAYGLDPEVERATLAYYLEQADDYLGSPMLSALYGVWAARTGDRALAAELLDKGYGRFLSGRFMQTLEYRPDVFPEQPRAGPFFANMGGFLVSLILGFPRLQPGPADPQSWCAGPVVLPRGWRAIEIDRLWIRGEPWRLSARDGADRAELVRL